MTADRHVARRAVALLALLAFVVLTVVAALTLTVRPAVADSASLAGTRVAASNHDPGEGVGTSGDVGPGQGRETAADSYDSALGCCVATQSTGGGGPRRTHVDVGGEGDYPGAINVNPSTEGMNGPIPNRVPGTAQNNPLPSGGADIVTAENIPIHQPGAVEGVSRLVKPGGFVSVANPADYAPGMAAHQALIDRLGGAAGQVIDPDGVMHTWVSGVGR